MPRACVDQFLAQANHIPVVPTMTTPDGAEHEFDWGVAANNKWFHNTVKKEIFADDTYQRFFKIKPGDVVIDLGSGAGNDCFIARAQTGATGKVIGIDFTEAMIDKARANAEKLGFNNIEFRYGDIEKMPVTAKVADVVVSNCVLNQVPNKANVMKEIFRVLKPGGHFSISDVVLIGQLPDALRKDAEMYAGCIAGAIQKEVYLELIHTTGFSNVSIQSEKPIEIPDDILKRYLSDVELLNLKTGNTGIFSITVYAEKNKSCGCDTDYCK
jgi:SAM-dependent methyltransferase